MSSSAPDVAESSRARQEAEQEPKSEPPRKWVALVSVIDVPGNEDDERAQKIVRGTDVLLDRDVDPPLPSYMVLHPRVAPDPRRNDGPLSAYILAADRSGFILLQVIEGNIPDFFLCNTHTSTVTLLPPVSSDIRDSEGLDIRRDGSIGLIADPDRRGHFVVAQLHPTTSLDHPNKLLLYSTATGQWSFRHLTLPRGRVANPFSETGVLAHDGRLWWISLAYGVFFCDPCTPHPQLRFVKLPPDCEMAGDVGFDRRTRTLLDQRRCVRLSEGKLRFVEICGLPYDVLVNANAPPANLMLMMWRLDDPEGRDPWTLERMVFFADIWKSKTYADAGLNLIEVPHLALVDPNDHCVIYFYQGSKLFGVDTRKNKVVACKECPIDRDQAAFRSSRPFVDAWEMPPPPATLPGDDDSSPDDNVWSTQSYVEKRKLEVTKYVDSWLNQARLEWTRDTDENWKAWQMAPPPSDESSVDSGGQTDDETSDESSVNSGGQAGDEPEIGDMHKGLYDHTPDLVCLVCQKCFDEGICSRCTMQAKHALLDIKKSAMKSGDILGYCLLCHELARKNHNHLHEEMIIPLNFSDGKMVAWVRGNEPWASIFSGIQSDNCFNIAVGRPFLIHRPNAIRCKWCRDVIPMKWLRGSLISFCTLYCWVNAGNGGNGGAEAEQVTETLLTAQFGDEVNAICLTCRNVFSTTEGENHKNHDWLAVVTDNTKQSWVQIPPKHHFAKVWHQVKGCWDGEILIKHVVSDTCKNLKCRAPLVDGGGETCTLECSVELMMRHRNIPRPLLFR